MAIAVFSFSSLETWEGNFKFCASCLFAEGYKDRSIYFLRNSSNGEKHL